MSAPYPGTLERVQRATAVLRSMLPTLEAYAAAMVGHRIPVEVGAETGTDGKRVIVAPPLALADLGPHVVSRCGARDDLGLLTCPTCAGMESVLVELRHELAHHVWETFVQHSFGDGRGYRTLHEVIDHMPEPVAALARVLESVRVDRAACDADPQGAGAHYAMYVAKVARGDDPATPPLEGANLATRFTWALLTAGVGADTGEFVGDDAMSLLADPVVDHLVGDDYEIGQVPTIAANLYERLVELGVFEPPEQPEQPEQPGDSDTDDQTGDDESDAPGAEPGAGEEGSGDGESEDAQDSAAGPPGDEGDPDGPGTDPQASGSDAEGDPAGADTGTGAEDTGGDSAGADAASPAQGSPGRAEDVAQALGDLYGAAQAGLRDTDGPSPHQVADAVTSMLEHVEVLGEVSTTVRRINIYAPGDGPLMKSSAGRSHSRSDDRVLGGLVGRARRVFFDNRAVKRTKGQPRGRVEPTLLGKRAWNPEDNRVFGSRVRPTAPSYSVLIGMDDSYSTVGRGIAELIRNCADAMGQLCSRTGVEFSIYAHTTNEGSWGTKTYDMEIYQLKTWSEQWTPQVRDRLGHLEPGNTNQDGSILRLYRRQLQTRPTTEKILLYFTDGEIPGTGGSAEAAIMRSEVDACRRAGITLLGVGIKTRSPEKFGIPTVSLDKATDIGHVLEFLAKEFGI